MSLNTLPLVLAARLVTRRHKRNYTGRHHQPGNAPANHLLSPAAYQLVTGTPDPVPASCDDATGLLRIRDIHPTGQFTTVSVNGVNTGGAA